MKRTICTCDRCGKTIYCDADTFEEAKKLPLIFTSIKRYGLYGDKELELCYPCQKELYKWMYGKEFVV